MKDYQNAIVTMFLKTSLFFVEHPELTGNYPILQKHVYILDSDLSVLDGFIKVQEVDTSYHRRKVERKAELVNTVFRLSSTLCSFANDANIAPIFDEFDKPISIIERMKDNDLVTYSSNCVDELTNNEKALDPYGIKIEQIQDMDAKTDAYKKLLLESKVARIDSKATTNNIICMLPLISDHLRNSIDKDMANFQTSDHVLYEKYIEARDIDESEINLGSTTVQDVSLKKVMQMQEN